MRWVLKILLLCVWAGVNPAHTWGQFPTAVMNVPSAPAATHWTFNASYKSADVTLSSGNLVTTFTSATQSIAIATLPGSTTGKSTGKWVWEFTVTTGGGVWSAGVISGLSPSSYSQHLGADAHGYAYYSSAGGWWAASVGPSFASCGSVGTYWSVAGNVISFELDAGGNSLAIYLNGTLQCTKTLSGGNYFPATSSVTPNVGTWNFGATAFSRTPTSGYIALN